jgi:Mn-dependent DtxR family transcriptional regulator
VYIYLNGARKRLPFASHPNPAHKEYTMEDKVLNAMKEAGKPVRPGDIAKALGVDSKEVSKACAELKKAGKIHSPKRCYYEPVAE